MEKLSGLQLINAVIEIIKTISVLIASGVAIYGINSWRRETKWKVKYNLAEEVLTLAFEIQEAIKEIRSPVIWGNEGKTRPKGENENAANAKIWDRQYILHERYEQRKDAFIKIKTIKYRFLAGYGREYESLFDRLDRQINDLFAANNDLFMYEGEGRQVHWATEEEYKRHIEDMRNCRKILYAQSKNDEFSKQFNGIIEEFDGLCGAIIRKEQAGIFS